MNTKQSRVFLTACSQNAVSALLLATLAAVAPAQYNGWVSHGPRDAGNAVGIGALALDPQNPSTIWAGGTGLFRSTDAGLSWSPAGGLPGSGDVQALAIDPENPRTMYAGSKGIHRTEDGGETWTLSSSNSYAYLGAHFLALDPDHRRIWRGHGAGIRSSGGGLRYSNDGARTFQSVPSVTQTIYSILFDPRRPGSIYGGSYNRLSAPEDGYAAGGSIFVSRDNGLTFTKGATNFGGWVISMAADPFEDILYAATGRGFRSNWRVLRSLDGGTTWEAAGEGGTPLHKIIADPVRRGRLYASTSNGVFRSTDGARTWEHIGLTNTSDEIVITPDGRWLYAGTSGGVFQLDLELEFSLDLSVGSDTRTRLLRTNIINGSMELESLDDSGAPISTASYGPSSGWSARAVADGSDGLTRLLWNKLDGSTALQLLGPSGDQVSVYRYAPVGNWTAVDVSVGPDNTTHLLWTNVDGRMGLGSLDGSGALVNGASYGPYSGWSARSISHGADGLTRVLWTKTDGTAGLSLFGAGGIVATYRFGPGYGWTARDIAVASDNQTRILWANSDGRMTLWSVDNLGAVTSSESVYEPPVSGQAATRISAGADGLTRVLWTSPEGTGTLWLMGLDNVFQSSFGLN
jgi:hypothetical protein